MAFHPLFRLGAIPQGGGVKSMFAFWMGGAAITAGIAPETPAVELTLNQPAGAIGPAFGRRKPEYRSTFAELRTRAAREERQETIRQLDELAQYVDKAPSIETRSEHFGIRTSIEALAGGALDRSPMALYSEIERLSNLIAETIDRDDEDAMALILTMVLR